MGNLFSPKKPWLYMNLLGSVALTYSNAVGIISFTQMFIGAFTLGLLIAIFEITIGN